MNELQQAASAFGTVALTILTWYLKSWHSQQKRQKSANAIIDAAKVFDLLNELGVRVQADRLMICYTSNGGGIPTAGKHQFASILYEIVRGKGLESIRKDFQEVLIDGGFVQLLQAVISEGRWRGKTEDLQLGILRTLFEEHGVTSADIFEIARTERKYYFGVIKWTSSIPPSKAQMDLMVAAAKPQLEALLT